MAGNPDGGRQNDPQAHGHGQQQPTQGPQNAQSPGQQNQDTGTSVTDAFSRPDTKSEILLGTGVYAAISVGMGIGAFGLKNLLSGSGGLGLGSLLLAFVTIMSPFYLGPVLGGVLALRHSRVFSDLELSLVYGTTAGTGFVGTFVMFVVGFLFLAIASDGGGSSSGGGDLGDLLVPVLIACFGAAIAATAVVWLMDRYRPHS